MLTPSAWGGFAIRISRGSRGPAQKPLALQTGKPPLGIVPGTHHGLQAGHRPPAVQDEDRLTMLHLVNQCAQVVLGIGQGGSLHVARIATSVCQLKPRRGVWWIV